jgi:hypothetical protein
VSRGFSKRIKKNNFSISFKKRSKSFAIDPNPLIQIHLFFKNSVRTDRGGKTNLEAFKLFE